MSKKVWFSLPLDFSSELNSSEDSHAGREFCRLLEDSEESELSQYSYTTPQQTHTTVNQLSQYSYNSSTKLHASAGELSQYSISAMDTNSTNETYSTNDSQDISTSQQSSEANLSQSGLEDGPSISSAHESQHEEVVNSAIMEVSGELMLGKLSQQKYPSGGSESSDISDDDFRRVATGGAIVKYPESSTGMSDNDWNPYATESDTNHTPRSAPNEEFRHAGGEPLTTVSMVTGEVTRESEVQPKLQMASRNVSDDYRLIDRPESESYKPRYRDETPETLKDDADSRSGRLDILRYMIDDSKAGVAQALERQTDDKNKLELEVGASPTDKDDEGRKSVESNKSDISEPSQRSQGGFSRDSEETLKGRESAGSALSLPLDFGMDIQPDRLSEEKSRRESAESAKSLPSDRTDSQSGRQSAESGRSDEYKRESIESYKSLPAEEYGGRSGRQSTEASRSPRSGRQSLESWKSPRSELDQSGEARTSGRESAESQHSLRSDRSRGSEHSQRSQRSQGSVGSGIGRDRLDKLNVVGDNIKELIEVESAQRPSVFDALLNQERVIDRNKDPGAGDMSRRVKLSEKFEAFKAPARSLKSPPTSASASYISIAERERLLSESPDFTGMSSQTGSKDTHLYKPDSNFKDAYPQDLRSSASAGARSPTGVAINRVSDLFEETKKQSRAAVSLPRPDPSGSEERFPLRERLSVSQHDDSFKSHDRSHDRTGHYGIGEKSRDSETARSITSEEVARVLGRYADTEAELKRTRMEIEKENRKPGVQISAFDKMDRSGNALRSGGIYGNFEAAHPDMSDDEIAKRVQAILSDTEYLGIVGGNGKTLGRDISDPTEKYVPHTIDYSKLQRDLQEIQDSLHDVPPPKANDSMYQFRPSGETEGEQHNLSGTSDSVPFKSAETTSTSGRESGISNFGRKLAWDHAADLNYDDGATGHFYGTMSTDNTLGGTQKLRKSGASDSDNLVVRAESTTTNDSETDDQIRQENTMAAAHSIVDQVLSRHAEGPLQETVEDIIARYRNERKDLKDKFQPGKDLVSDKETMPIERPVKELQSNLPIRAPTTEIPPSTVDVNTNAIRPPQMGNKQAGLAERVYKILSSDQGPEPYQAPPPQLEQGMAKKVYQILSSDRPGTQVNGILTDTMEKEHEMLKSLVQQQQAEKDDSSFEVPPRLNGTSDSFALSERDVRRQLEWSLLSSPGKGDKTGLSDFSTIRKVTSAPYSSVDTAKTLLSAQMQKMTERNFDKSVELRTPFRQAIDCYPVNGVERDRKQEPEQRTREAWMPVPNPSSQSPEKAAEKRDPLASERFYLTHKDSSPRRQATRGHYESPQRHRTYSDPFEVSPSRNPTDRGHHPRSKSEGPADVSDLTQLSYDSKRYDSTNRRAASSSHRLSTGTDTSTEQPAGPVGLVTPARHNPQDSGHESISPTESDSSGSKKLSKLRPYRPAGSRDVYYTESADDTNESGTTIESTHPGSDDAVPPYIPKQYLGTRTEEPARHPTGIYSTSSKDALSTIDEKSQDGKERLSGSDSGAVGREPEAQLRVRSMYTDSDRSGEPGSKSKDTVSRSLATDAGYQTGATAKSSYEAERSREAEQRREAAVLERQRDEARLRELELKRKLDDLKENYLNKADVRPFATGRENREDKILKTREEYLRDLEAREGENMLRHQFAEEKRDPFGASVRSDPGGMLDDHRDMADLAEFRLLEPDPLYPQERVRHSRSRSETDLNTLSPAESQRYSSPMQPGTRFMELSSQPSPISHHESLRAQEPDTQPGYQPGTRTMTTSREPERQISSHSTARTGVPSSEVRDPVRETAKVRSESPRTEAELRYPAGARLENDRAAYTRVEARHFDNMYPQELPRVDDRRYPMELPVVPEPRDTMRADEREVEPAKRRGSGDPQRSISPLHVREKELERELEEMKRELAAQVQEVQENNAIADTEEFEDNFPPSKKAQVLREVLEQEYIDNIPPNINDMWNRFKELNDNTRSESSLNSTRLDALSGLLQNPTQHTVQSFVSEKEEERRKKKQEMEEAERVMAERMAEKEREKRLALEKAAYERIVKKREMRQQQQRLSEEESNGSYVEILMEREKKERVKDIQKNKEGQKSREKKSTKTPESEKAHKKSRKNKENQSHKSPEEKAKHSKESRREEMRRMAKIQAQHSDTMDTLFSIPEDASFEMSPTKLESELKARQKRHRHVIDPLMKKLRDKIKLQRDKIDKERRKELQRVEKLKKLEMLLTAKRKGKLSDKAIDVELGNVSSTTANSQSESSLMSSDATLTAGSTTMESDGSSQGSTTLKESSIDSHISPKLQYKKYEDPESFATPKKHYPETDSSATHSETSDFSNIVVERIPEKKSSEKKSRSKEKKSRKEGSGHKVRKEKDNKKKKVFGVELSDELLTKQLQRYEKYISPGKHRKQMDAATMYPSPITVSPVTRRRLRDVYMKSEAIQTSPSIRSTSPCHSYDETPVAPVPLMAGTKQHSQHRRQSPDQSSMSQSRMSRSPVDKSRSRSSGSRKSLRKSSRSPAAETQTDISASLSKPKTVSQTRRKKPQSPMWKPETPPKNSMFEPEMTDENREPFTKDQDIPQGTSWFIPLKPSQPWRKPLKERQAFSVSREPWETKSVSQSTWKKIVHGDILKDRSDVTNVSRDTKFDLDTTGQRIGDEESESGSEESDEDVLPSKPLSKMTLQEAFQQRKQVVLSRLRERQKRLHLAAEERKMQAYLQLERDRLFQEERKKEANPEAHPYSDNLFRPTRRVISKEEMKEMAKKKYKKLPEVVEQAKLQKRAEQYSLNRLKARLFNRKVQRHVLVKAEKWGR